VSYDVSAIALAKEEALCEIENHSLQISQHMLSSAATQKRNLQPKRINLDAYTRPSMIYWYEQVAYGLALLFLIHAFKFYFLGNEDIFLTFIKYCRKKNDSE
jgi:hypothetical protein